MVTALKLVLVEQVRWPEQSQVLDPGDKETP